MNITGIPVIYDAPVGKKLYDHLCFVGMIYQFNESIAINLDNAVSAFPDYIRHKKGPLTSIGK